MKAMIILAIFTVLAVRESGSVRLEPRIVGGNYAEDGQFPYQVAVKKTKGRMHHCGAAILTERFILSAAHSFQFEYSDPKLLYAVVGTVYPQGKGVEYAFDKIIVHNLFSPETIYNDIALLRTAEKIVFSDWIQPIALPTTNTPANVVAYASGWGLTMPNAGTASDYMKFAQIRTMSQKACYDFHKGFGIHKQIVKTSLCARAGNGDGTCTGDSGKCICTLCTKNYT